MIETIGERNRARIETLGCFGYGEREAAFLCLAGLHSGYFMRRQYVQFVGKRVGGTAAALIEKVLAHEHAKALTYSANAQIYHLCSRPFYAALGQADNRNRRDRRPLTIKTKLMALDFVLDHPSSDFLGTEHEKFEYFTGTLSVPADALPTAVFRGQSSHDFAVRYFVDKFPIYAGSSREDAGPEPTFCYIDAGATTVCGFETYLTRYRPLFSRLPRFRVVYVAARPLLFQAAERTFHRFVCSHDGHSDWEDNQITGELREYFEARSLYESGELTSFDRAKLIRLRDLRSQFSGAAIDRLFEAWKEAGAHVSTTVSITKRPPTPALPGVFSVSLLAHNYDLFGSLTLF